MKKCKDFSSDKVFQTFYQGFLGWNLSISNLTEPLTPPEQVFWFTMRDSSVFGIPEFFGLVSKCGDSHCKMTQDKPYVTSRMQPQSSRTGQEEKSTAVSPGHRSATSGRQLTGLTQELGLAEEEGSSVGWPTWAILVAGAVALCTAGVRAQRTESAQKSSKQAADEAFLLQDLSPGSLRPRGGSPTAFYE
ncbi:unnamed protein product [Polarella glacialis]|uniref:Uncharacterized protein n=1 Tax=Polarella glacialis TaxID=89957 RepID=A0A813K0X9_POLGL|nr:unnamed protein product [Polarella glacialis]